MVEGSCKDDLIKILFVTVVQMGGVCTRTGAVGTGRRRYLRVELTELGSCLDVWDKEGVKDVFREVGDGGMLGDDGEGGKVELGGPPHSGSS